MSSPVPPSASSGACCPALSQPRVVATVAKTSSSSEPPIVLPPSAADVALEAVDLADLEGVVAGAAVERRDRAVVVDGEDVVAAQAEDA